MQYFNAIRIQAVVDIAFLLKACLKLLGGKSLAHFWLPFFIYQRVGTAESQCCGAVLSLNKELGISCYSSIK